jgi:hypothetical protein
VQRAPTAKRNDRTPPYDTNLNTPSSHKASVLFKLQACSKHMLCVNGQILQHASSTHATMDTPHNAHAHMRCTSR